MGIVLYKRKLRPSPPNWWTFDNDNCWFCRNRNNTIYVVYAINEGKRYNQDIKYPIRINGSKFSSKILEQIKIDLKNNIPKTQIAKKYSVGRKTLYEAINNYMGGI